MYRFSPKRSNKIALLLATFSLIASVIFVGTPIAFEGMAFAGVSQTLGVMSLALAILVITRYFTKSLVYEIREDSEGLPDLCVSEYQGKRGVTVCRISLAGIERVEICADKAKKAELAGEGKGRKVYSYFADIAPDKYICVFATECGEELVIKLAFDDRLFEILSRGK